jgi:hypothetical protein
MSCVDAITVTVYFVSVGLILIVLALMLFG